MKVSVILGDITTLAVDAIVNSTKHNLLGGGHIHGVIHRAAGPEMMQECLNVGGLETGHACLTMGHKLPAKYVVHTVAPMKLPEEETRSLLKLCYQQCFKVAAAHGVQTIAFPALHTDYPLDRAAQVAVIEALRRKGDLIREVVFCLDDEAHLNHYWRYFSS